MSDIVRVLRLIEYVGERAAVESQVARSIHGTRCPGTVSITAVSLHEFPQAAEEREAVLLERTSLQQAEIEALRQTVAKAGEI